MDDVFWAPRALNDLAALWRDAITVAAAEIDSLLANSPDEVGESRPHERRIAFVGPLGFIFRIRREEGYVVVSRVWLI
jgi:hypothetical protein